MTFKTKYSFGQVVYLVTDPKQLRYQITGIYLFPDSHEFILSRDGFSMEPVFEVEISETMNMEIRVTEGQRLDNDDDGDVEK